MRLFIDWLKTYSELDFKVVAIIYKHGTSGVTREGVWNDLGKQKVAENTADADLFKLLFRNLTIGGVIRQHREVDFKGDFIVKKKIRPVKGFGTKTSTSAFDSEDSYELTELGKQFVHYAMTDLSLKIDYKP